MTCKQTKRLFLIVLVTIFYNPLYSQEVVNGSFEFLNGTNFPVNWKVYDETGKYKITVDRSVFHSGKQSVLIRGKEYKESSLSNSVVFANTYGAISNKSITKVSLSAYLKVVEKKDSAVAIFIQSLNGDTIIRKYLNPKNVGQWTKVNLEFSPFSGKQWYGFYYGAELSKNIDFLIDDVQLEVDGKIIESPKAFTFNPSKKDIQWLNKNLFEIKSVARDNDFSNFNQIGNIIGNSKIIGVGEPTHGTSEASKLKLKLFKYLVIHKNISTFAMEETIPCADSLNAIINNSSVSLKESMLKSSLYNCWKTEEVLSVFEWIRDFNATNKHKIRFIGVDMEDSWLKSSISMLEPYTETSTSFSESFKKFKIDIDTLRGLNKQKKFKEAAELAQTLINTLDHIRIASVKNDTGFRFNTYLNVCKQWLTTRFLINPQPKTRDEYMAQNLSYYLENHPDEKVFLWAHNMHIANIDAPEKSMGAFLKQKFRDNYLPLCVTSSEGSYLAAEDYSQKVWKSYPFENAYQGTYEYILKKTRAPIYFLPFTNSQKVKWINIPMQQLDHGYIFGDGTDYKFLGNNINVLFDGLLFIKKTTASVSLIK